jgi:hypothetical protein
MSKDTGFNAFDGAIKRLAKAQERRRRDCEWPDLPGEEIYRRYAQLEALLGQDVIRTDAVVGAVCHLHTHLPDFDLLNCVAQVAVELAKSRQELIRRADPLGLFPGPVRSPR